ncbi:hypothetical protein PFISCL1PPCAC_18042, partial [Pristionchus fissidentatus]
AFQVVHANLEPSTDRPSNSVDPALNEAERALVAAASLQDVDQRKVACCTGATHYLGLLFPGKQIASTATVNAAGFVQG